jgi:hypothetical protein
VVVANGTLIDRVENWRLSTGLLGGERVAANVP